jgi:hypothetical protein
MGDQAASFIGYVNGLSGEKALRTFGVFAERL